MFTEPEIQFAIRAVRQAASVIGQVQRELAGQAMTKEDRSPVTVADYAAQAVVARLLAEAFPDSVLVAEESAEALRRAEHREQLDQVARFVRMAAPGASCEQIFDWIDRGNSQPTDSYWTLDPLDGTKGFLRGDQYAVALAQVCGGVVRIGVLGCPQLADVRSAAVGGPGSLIVAARGKGTWTRPLEAETDPTPLRVSDRRELAEARILRSYVAAHTNTGQIGTLIERLGIEADPVAMDSQAKYAVLAAGGGDVLVRLLSPAQPDYREKIWDQAAGSIVVEEAGGEVTDLAGNRLDFSTGRTLARNRGVVATNGRLHAPVLEALAQLD